MSEQVSFAAGAGLLSLNLTALPQGPSSLTPESAQALAGFNALLAQQAATSDLPAAGSGGILPPQGVNLPQSEQVADDEAIRQQLLNLAQLLEQQESVDTDGLAILPEVTRELSKALRDYAQQSDISELPAEVQAALEAQADAEAAASSLAVTPSLPSTPLTTETVAPTSVATESLVSSDTQQSSSLLPNASAQNASLSPEISTLQPQSTSTLEGNTAANAQAQSLAQQELAAQNARPDPVAVPGNSAQISAQSTETSTLVGSAANADRNLTDLARRQNSLNAELESRGQAQAAADADEAAQALTARRVTEPVSTLAPVRSNAEAPVVPQDVLPARVVPERAQAADITTATQTLAATAADENSPVANNNIRLEQPLNLQRADISLDDPQQLLQKNLSAERAATETGGTQRLESNNAASQSVPQHVSQPTQVQKAVTEANNLLMPHQVKINTPAWNSALGERAVLIATQNSRVAEIQLDPPELGSLNVRVQINQDQVSLSFTSPHAHVRDAVEQSLPRLREMFAEQGLALNESSVSDQQQSDRQREGVDERYAGDRQGSGYGDGEQGDEAEQVNVRTGTVSLVDYYA